MEKLELAPSIDLHLITAVYPDGTTMLCSEIEEIGNAAYFDATHKLIKEHGGVPKMYANITDVSAN